VFFKSSRKKLNTGCQLASGIFYVYQIDYECFYRDLAYLLAVRMVKSFEKKSKAITNKYSDTG